jgi:hypothetical protein
LGGFVTPGIPSYHYVFLSVPATEPPDPNELPPVTYDGIVVSDLIISGTNATNTPFVALISDNNPDLATFVPASGNTEAIIPETGALQNVTALLGNPVIGGITVTVEVQSGTAAPAPSTLATVVLGAVPILIARRRLGMC